MPGEPLLRGPREQVIADGEAGKVAVTLMGDERQDLLGVNVQLRMVRGTNPAFEFTPGWITQDLTGFYLPRIPAKENVTLTFGVARVHAEVGKIYEVEARAAFEKGAEGIARTIDPLLFHIRVDARPEVYAVLGAAEKARKVLRTMYEDLQEEGRKAHEGHNTVLPSFDPGQPLEKVLSQDQFEWALKMVQVGARLFERSKKNP